MTKDRQKLGVLIVLLGVLAATSLMAYRMNAPPTTAAVQTPAAAKTSANPPSPSDARILLELVEKEAAAKENIGDRNLFQYRQTPLPPPVSRSPATALPGAGVSMQPTPVPVQTQTQRAPSPPVLPPIPLKYQGFATTGAAQGLTAFLADDARHYNVTAGEVLMGRYRISSITDKSVEVEDLENNRRQTLPLLN